MIKRYTPPVACAAADAAVLEWRVLRPEVRLPMRLSERQRHVLLASMLEPGGLQEACTLAGVTLGMVLGERLRNPAFRRLWEKAQQQRRAILETLLLDMAVRGLLPGAAAPPSEAREKFLASLAQALAAADSPAEKGRRKPGEPRAPARKPTEASAQDRAQAANTAADADELTRLIADMERKIAAAEAAPGD